MAIGTTNFPASLDTADTLIQAADNALTTLSAAIDASVTTLPVISTATFPTSGIIAIGDELISYTGKTSTSFTGCTRGFDGTTAATHASGDNVEQLIAAAYHKTLVSALIATQTKVGAGTTANRAIVANGSGNYTASGITHDTNEILGNVGGLSFDTTPSGTGAAARLIWNDSDGTLNLGLKGGNVTLQIGQEQVSRVVNKSGVNLTEAGYNVVRVSTAQGQRIGVTRAQANSEPNSTDVLGIVTENIADNEEGFVTTHGLVNGINTTGSLQGETWADGDVLYLSPSMAGGLTNVKPSAPNHLIIVGYVAYAHANNGKIYVHIQQSWEIEELHNVKITSVTNGQALIYDGTNGYWKNAAISATAAGSSGDIQMNTSGALAASSLNQSASLIASALNFRVPATGGSSGTPNLQFGSGQYGLYTTGVYLAVSAAGATSLGWNGENGNTHINNGYQVVWGSSGLGSPDVGVTRSAAGVLRVTNGTTGAGKLLVASNSTTSGGQAHVVASAADVTALRVDSAASPTLPAFDVRINGTENTGIKVDASTTAGDTRFFLYDATSGAIQRVVVGANDSGGTGYRMLRIANA